MDEEGLVFRQNVSADNSCLFTAVAYCLSGELQSAAESRRSSVFLREIIANAVAADPIRYSEAFLERPNQDYVKWIKKSDSWGGAIELAILAEFYNMQISVVDIDAQTPHISSFGEGQNYPQRIFLIYDGTHYDPLYFEPFGGNARTTIFPTSNLTVMGLAMQLGHQTKAAREYTDTKNFTLRCQICNTLLKGQKEAENHAQMTGHDAFAEVKK